ncbi:MAG: AAA family ATPase [Planctomycetes bacterium]|nr:AAA family ATPase [Planctomycetota bacterium]
MARRLDVFQRAAKAVRGSVVAAAGCGKTELIAKSVAAAGGRQLVLTHTNAGVEALLRRMRRHGVPPSQVAIDTIHGWSLRYLGSYPGKSGGVPERESEVDWRRVCPAMQGLLDDAVTRRVVQASYDGVFVDEYQDCTHDQHGLVTTLARLLPVRVLGDPLQGVFRFDRPPPSWNREVEQEFPRVLELTTPWRWRRQGENAELGEWLLGVRRILREGGVLDFGGGPLRHVVTTSWGDWEGELQGVCFEGEQQQGTVASLHRWPQDYQQAGRVTGGYLQCVEPVHAPDAARALGSLQESQPAERGEILMTFLKLVTSGSGSVLDAVQQCMEGRDGDRGGRGADGGVDIGPAVRDAVADFLDPAMEDSAVAAAELLEAVASIPSAKVFRWELLRAAIDALRDARFYSAKSLLECLRARRSLLSRTGRRLSKRVSGSTLLLKGMEFDHGIVVMHREFNPYEMYVALTRGSKSLTVLAPIRRLRAPTVQGDRS